MSKSAMSYAAIVLRWVLIAVVLLVAVIGFLYITRGTSVKHVRGVGADGAPVSPEEPQFPLSVGVLTGTLLTEGNKVEIALNGDGTFPRLWADLRSARQAITVQMYYGLPGQVADTLSDILIERARAGVRVFVLYDAFGNQDIPESDMAKLRQAGALVVAFRPLTFSQPVRRSRTVRTSAPSWSMAASAGRAASASTTSGWVTADTPRAGGARPTCASRDPPCCSSSRHSRRRGPSRRGRS